MKKRSSSIPLGAFFRIEEDKQRARRALEHPERLPPSLAAQLERYLADPLNATVEDMQQLLDQRAKSTQGRPRPENPAKAHIREKLAEHPELAHQPTALRKHCDEEKLAGMPKPVFGNTVAAIRRETISHR